MSEPRRKPAANDQDCSAPHPTRDLATLQRWMQGVISHPEGIVAGISDDSTQCEIAVTPEGIEQVILPSRNLSSLDRLAVYGNAYYARLLECIHGMFPVLARTLGEEAFDAFAFAYLQQFPSQSYTLDRLADHFADFLEQTRPELLAQSEVDSGQEMVSAVPDWSDFIIDLARLETAVEQVFDGPGNEDLPLLAAEQVNAIAPERWAAVRLVPSPCLRLLEFKFSLSEYYSEVRAGRESPLPEPAASFLALWRRDYIVRRLTITREQYELLAAILAGRPIGDALAASAAVTDDFDNLAASLGSWFREWTAAGFFLSVELTPAL